MSTTTAYRHRPVLMRSQLHNLARHMGLQLARGSAEAIEQFAVEVFRRTNSAVWDRSLTPSTFLTRVARPLTVSRTFLEPLGDHEEGISWCFTELVTAIMLHAAHFTKQRRVNVISPGDILQHKLFTEAILSYIDTDDCDS